MNQILQKRPRTKQYKQQRKLKKLLRRTDIWRGESRRFVRRHFITSGYPQLDSMLVEQGWPLGGLIEVTQHELGMGEWQLIKPALQQLKQITGYIVLINPPEQPFAPGLSSLGLCLHSMIVIEAKNRADALAAFVDVLKHPACKALLFWECSSRLNLKLKPAAMRKLQLASANSKALCFLFRHTDILQQSSSAILRVSIAMRMSEIQVTLHKQRGTFQEKKSAKNKQVSFPLPNNWKALPELSSQRWLQPNAEPFPKARIIPFRANAIDRGHKRPTQQTTIERSS